MEQTALRPKPMPGQEPDGAASATRSGPARPRLHAARRRGRRLLCVLFGGFIGAVLVLSGISLGAMGTTLIGKGGVIDPRGRHTPPPPSPSPSAAASAPAAVTLGVQVMDAGKPGALVVGLHVPGPAQEAGLVRGDLLLVFGRTRIDTAADLARAVARARPGAEVKLTVRHRSGGYRQLTVVPAVVT
ncbi:PDZ domain-containing protein [Streptomyces caelestis]|uniref:Membrane-associated protease RseP (Regulator of RpoE activity) n=1 Tax=Streptomyces caelestis TaxID=36816 RepID=A0A7W9H9Q1_9ACTN|nr:PDZ domain-containing protein [Streptomyces caelestis]MBB5798260.1 membrane-associated protease RseP (regulator of RpoE activity) [Streptomyces caelestis]GGW49062.1 PDZ domain-containing protein [Streptomyces caelestis]